MITTVPMPIDPGEASPPLRLLHNRPSPAVTDAYTIPNDDSTTPMLFDHLSIQSSVFPPPIELNKFRHPSDNSPPSGFAHKGDNDVQKPINGILPRQQITAIQSHRQ